MSPLCACRPVSLSPHLQTCACFFTNVHIINSHLSLLVPVTHGYKYLAVVALSSTASTFCALCRITPSTRPPTQTGLTRCLSVLVGNVAVPRYPLSVPVASIRYLAVVAPSSPHLFWTFCSHSVRALLLMYTASGSLVSAI